MESAAQVQSVQAVGHSLPRGTWPNFVVESGWSACCNRSEPYSISRYPTARPSLTASPISIAILGNDALIAAAPALPVQLMHAALAVGFDAVVPVSLGDELAAGETLRLAQLHGRRPLVQCCCPFALSQLCKRDAGLAGATVAVAPAAVALARALRLERADVPHITYIGGCPGALDPSINLRVLPAPFLRGVARKGIVLLAQPRVFTDRIPPDRRRFLSLPGGAPRPELVEALLRRTVVTVSARMNPMLAVADALFDGGVTMIDPAGAYRCVCTGAASAPSVTEGRAAIATLEPARASSPIIDASPWLDLRPTEVSAVTDRVESTPVAAAPRVADTARNADIAQLWMESHVAPTSPALRATPIEREIRLAPHPRTPADRFADPIAPPLRRPTPIDDAVLRA